MKALIYCRTSRKNDGLIDPDKGVKEKNSKKVDTGKISLEIQRRECLELAAKIGASVDAERDIYIDNNFSCVTYPVGMEKQAEACANRRNSDL